MIQPEKTSHIWLCDLVFMVFSALYALLALEGVIAISGHGVHMDSDLATYAQAMTHALHPGFFASDPVLNSNSPAVDISNLERLVATLLMPGDNVAVGLFRAGAVAIFIFYCGWYILGRWLFKSPALSALLSVLCGITIWIEFGTFWGINHSDPIPRVYFAAIFPLLLLFALAAIKHAKFRPAAMFLTGLSIWVHGVSALNCGAMFFVAFALSKPGETGPGAHMAGLALCLFSFFLPVLCFLWPSLMQARNFSQEELAVFRNLFDLRWAADYSNSEARLLHLLTSKNACSLLALGGFFAWLLTVFKGSPREKTLALACPAFILAIFLVAIFCFAESRYAANLGRLSMGHELVRGIRFLVPLSLLMIVAAVRIILPRIVIRPGVCCVIALVAIFTVDRQYVAAQYALGQKTGIALPLAEGAKDMAENAEKRAKFLEKIEGTVPKGQAIFSEDEDMAIRYIALRPLAHAFKDGYIHFYNKDLAGSKKWLELERLLAEKPNGLIKAWLFSGAPWLLCRNTTDRKLLDEHGKIELELDGWLLVKKN